MNNFWDKVEKCNHKWSTDYTDGGRCGTPYCSWWEYYCIECGVYETRCGCGFMYGLSGEPLKKSLRRNRKKQR